MQQRVNRLRWAVLPVARRVVGVVALCVAALSFLAFHPAPHVSALSLSRMITGTLASSPSAGPVGTTIRVSGSGWHEADGTPVSFGYEVGSNCSIVSDSQNGSISGGSFSGWFRWPSGTPLNTYSVCVVIENVMTVAGSFSVLASSPPAVSISPATLKPHTLAAITASNYYPAGTPVNFLWVSGSTVIEKLNSAVSDTGGRAVLTFTVPKLSIANGSYSIDASTGSGQPATLFSSANFTYSAPVVRPSPTPQPSPRPSPTMTPGVTPTAKASATVTSVSPTAGASPTTGNSQTPVTNSTNSGNNGDTNTGAPPSSSLDNPLLIGGMAVLAGALLAGVAALLLLSRRRKAARAKATEKPPANSNPFSYPSYNSFSAPDMSGPLAGNMPAMPLTPAPVLIGAGTRTANGNAAAPAAHPNIDAMPPVPASSQPPAWLTSVPAKVSAPPTTSIIADPALEAIRLQAQTGLIVLPRPFKDERSQ